MMNSNNWAIAKILPSIFADLFQWEIQSLRFLPRLSVQKKSNRWRLKDVSSNSCGDLLHLNIEMFVKA